MARTAHQGRRHRRVNFRGYKYVGHGIYEDEGGDKFKMIGKRKLLRITDVQMGLERRRRRPSERIDVFLIKLIVIAIIALMIYSILKIF